MRFDNLELKDDFYEKCSFFTKKLLEWNKIHNLTGAKSEKEVWENIEDSVYPVKFLSPVKKAMDIGTGAGFPGLILAFALKDTEFLLVEPRNKRAAFLNYIVATLELKNVKVEKKRVEELPAEPFDLITSRAVAKTFFLIELCRTFIKKDTILLFYKGEEVDNEVEELKDFSFDIIRRGKRRYLFIKNKRI
ncbi:16S rRNA (guanine(527)-N(7))-methyltransferase RsmG [Nitrosophilus labii]|uniref:16S rRNA (guanine(527)-N(7))-methyltransferase RsmG n=1 Tax=Nitrosophilus labii TaxID=2706014 RepID=UPI0016575980|nr:16S rRNA (guanine(527)-N(7))-methyltransferase RsmG [Nitrosophilus labii]